jgi:hypothetical protein
MRKMKHVLIAVLAMLLVVTACKISFGGDEQDEAISYPDGHRRHADRQRRTDLHSGS